MNKLLIGLLLVAAGAGAYFLLKKKKDQPVANVLNKELIIGKWKPGNTEPGDSSNVSYRYEFLKDGTVLHSLNDSVKADSSHYEWNKKDELVWKENPVDSAGRVFSIVKLTTDSLQVQLPDSSTLLFTRTN